MSRAAPTAAAEPVPVTVRARTGPIRRIIAGSLATGAVSAAIVTLVVVGDPSSPVRRCSVSPSAGRCWQCCRPG
jgi:hypothetical protein